MFHDVALPLRPIAPDTNGKYHSVKGGDLLFSAELPVRYLFSKPAVSADIGNPAHTAAQ
jgi:hypothetical protein